MHLVLSKLNLVLSKLDVFKLVISWYCTPWYYTDVCVACVFVCVCVVTCITTASSDYWQTRSVRCRNSDPCE